RRPARRRAQAAAGGEGDVGWLGPKGRNPPFAGCKAPMAGYAGSRLTTLPKIDMSELLVPFSYDYMLKAMWGSAVVGGTCAFLSAYLMLKGWSLMGDALGHAIVPGVAAAYLFKLPYAAGAFIAGILAAFGMTLVRTHTRLREDAVIGIVFTSFFAA